MRRRPGSLTLWSMDSRVRLWHHADQLHFDTYMMTSTDYLKTLISFLMTVSAVAHAADTSRYLGNNQRTGAVEASVPDQPAVQWVYQERHAPDHAWQNPSREVQFIDFDYASNVAIADGLAVFGSSSDHTVRALDLDSGRERWVMRLEAPVRFDPVVGEDCLYITGDDGYLRCVETQTGKPIWKKRMGPKDLRCMGNDQLISRWPARSGAVLEGNKLYCAGGMWSRDGVMIYCLDAKTGKEIWKNDTSGFLFTDMPHGEGFGGVAPQGNLVLYQDMLYVPTGRSEPAFLNAATGKLVHFATGVGYKAQYPGGSWVMAAHDRVWFKRRTNHGEANIKEDDGIRDPGPSTSSGIIGWNFKTGKPEMALTDKNLAAFRDDVVVMSGYGPVIRASYQAMTEKYRDYFDLKTSKSLALDPNIQAPETFGEEFGYARDFFRNLRHDGTGSKKMNQIHPMFMTPNTFAEWETDLGRVFFLRIANDKVIAGGRGTVSLLDLETGAVLWDYAVEGEARNVVVVDGRFIVSTSSGHLYCFGAEPGDPVPLQAAREAQQLKPGAEEKAKQILQDSGVREGYAFLLGAGSSPDIMLGLIQHSDLVVYGLESNRTRAEALRKQLDLAGYLGVRGQVLTTPMNALPLNPYIGDLVVFRASERGENSLDPREIHRITRPCGGVAYAICGKKKHGEVQAWFSDVAAGMEATPGSTGLMMTRGRIPGAGDWSHPMANVGRTGSSDDEVAKTPLSMLWWGGPGSARGMERHDYPPIPVYCNGRLYIQGEHDVYAVNAYNGRELWNRTFAGVGRWPQFGRGGNIVADEEAVYMVYDNACFALDGRTGETIREYVVEDPDQYKVVEWSRKNLPKKENRGKPEWDFLAVTDDYVIGTLCAANTTPTTVYKVLANPYEARVVFVFEKKSGKMLWSNVLDRVVASNALVSDGQRLYLLDRTNEGRFLFMRKKGGSGDVTSVLRAFDLKSGDEIWTVPDVNPMVKELQVSGGVVVGGPSRGGEDKSGETAILAVDASNGSVLWKHDDLGVFNAGGRNVSRQVTFILDDTLYVVPHAFDLRTGAVRKPLTDPITGEDACFEISGQNFCGGVSASKNLALYRSTSAGIQDINKNSGSYWLPEVRSSCEISLIPAGGLVLSPEGSSTCVCSFSYKTSLALFPEPKHEDWSMVLDKNMYGPHKKRNMAIKPRGTVQEVKHLRLNLNAPGDKTDDANQTWFGFPRDWSKSQKMVDKTLPVKGTGIQSEYHVNADTTLVGNTDRPWLYTSGLYGPLALDVETRSDDRYTVVLHFAEMNPTQSPRVFDVRIGNKHLKTVKVQQEAGRPVALKKTVSGVAPANGRIQIKLQPGTGRPPVLCAVEVIRDEKS